MQRRTLAVGALRRLDARNLRRTIAGCEGLGNTLARLATDAGVVALRAVPLGDLIDAVAGDPAPIAYLRPLPAPEALARTADAGLSPREIEVMRLIARGLSNKAIGVRLGLSDKTIKNHISHLLRKLGLTARTQVAILALRAGFE